MKMSRMLLFLATWLMFVGSAGANDYVYKPGHESLKVWIIPDKAPHPDDNPPTPEKIELGKKLFFDPRFSAKGNMSCASCHSPLFGWSDGLPTAIGFEGKILDRASPTVVNSGFNFLQMWDGRKKTLEAQATGPLEADVEMNMNLERLNEVLVAIPGYQALFKKAFPKEKMDSSTFAKAIAAYERTIISKGSPFDRWLRGDAKAMTADQVEGFKLFVDPNKGNCAVCHGPPNFTDNGFHNIGLAQFGSNKPDFGRHHLRPLRLMKGAFKTPTLWEISKTGPYFHDGSAKDLDAVLDHYIKGGVAKENLSPNMKALTLTDKEKAKIIDFMKALSSPPSEFTLPTLPL